MEKKLDEVGQFKKIQTDFRQSLSALREDHEEWREYDEFYLAKHWTAQRASWLPDPVINYIAFVVDQKSPQLTNNRPQGLILPTAQGDEPTAKLFTQVTDVISERVGLDEVIAEIVPTGLLLGTSWFKVYWDNSLSGGTVAAGNVWKGDVCIEAPDPTNIYHDPQAYKVEDCRYIIYAVPKTIQWVKEKFNVEVEGENAFETEIYQRPGVVQAKDRVMLYEYWYKENGTINVCYAAGGKVLKEIKKVYKHGRYPFVRFTPKKKRKSLTGIGEPKNIIANQKLLNKFVEMLTRNTMLTANPILLVDDKSGINPNTFQAKPGIVQKVHGLNGGGKVMEWFEPPQISNDVPETIDKLVQFIERMGGVYDANTGQTPGGVTAAAAIQMLQEQGSIPIKGIERNLFATIKDVYELMIELVKENYTEQRYIRITDDQGNFQFQPFVGAQYAEVDLDVKVSAGASTPTSKAFISQLGADLFKDGVLLGSEYVDMQDGLPNKDRVVTRLRESEGVQNKLSALDEQEKLVFDQLPPDAIKQMLQQFMQPSPEQQQTQIDAEQAKTEQQFQQQATLKQMDHTNKMDIEAMKVQAALQQAAMKQPAGTR